jgi:hypothetical protein
LTNNTLSFDIDRVVSRYGPGKEKYYNVLESYVRNTRVLLEKLKNVKDDNLGAYAITVHGIEGSSRGVFANEIASLAQKMKEIAYNGDYEYINANNHLFIETVMKLLADIEYVLKTNIKVDKPKKEEPDKEQLVNLLEACKKYDIDEIDKTIANIERYQYTNDEGFIINLQDLLSQGRIQNIIEMINDYITEKFL